MSIRDFLSRLNAFSPGYDFPLRSSPFQEPQGFESNVSRFLRRLNLFAPPEPLRPNIPAPVTQNLPAPTFDDYYLRRYGQHIQNYPQAEPPEKLRRLSAALSGGSASLLEGPTAGAVLTQSILQDPYEKRVRDWTNQAQQYQKAAEIEGTSAKNLAAFMLQQRKLDMDEAYKAGSLDIRQDRTENQRRQIELNHQIALQKLAQSNWTPLNEPDKDGNIIIVDKTTGEYRKLPANMMSSPERFKAALDRAVAVANIYTQGALERKLIDVDINEARLALQADIANLRNQGLSGNALHREIEKRAVELLAVENPDAVGRTIVYGAGNRLMLAAIPGYMDEYIKLQARLNEIRNELGASTQAPPVVAPRIRRRNDQPTTRPIVNILETFREVKRYIPEATSIMMDPVHGWIARDSRGRWFKIDESNGRWFVVENQ